MAEPADAPPVRPLLAFLLASFLLDYPIAIFELVVSPEHNKLLIAQFVFKTLAYLSLLAYLWLRFFLIDVDQRRVRMSVVEVPLAIFCVGFCVGMIIRVFNNQMVLRSCQGLSPVLAWYAGCSEDNHLSFDFLVLMVTPVLFHALLHDSISIRLLVHSLRALCLASLVGIAAATHSSDLGYSALYGAVVSGVLHLSSADKARSAEQLQQRREREREEVLNDFDQNTKSLVGNVAHDLKTPLSSFMAGIEIISELASEVMQKLAAGGCVDKTFLCDMLATTLQCVRNIRNTNNFMLMTINRCIDYTKAAKGIKLVPKLDTVDLLEAMLLPMTCMKDIQNRVTIVMDSVDDDICSHVITDKQWLQENVLCLLSNAVKYSSGGHVVLRLALDEDVELADIEPASPTAQRPRELRSFRAVAPIMEPAELRASLASTQRFVSRRGGRSSRGQRDMYDTSVLLIEVEDSGIGMSESAMAKLFSPFQQTQRLAGGTGLGLYSLSKRVEALRGKCGVNRRRDGRQGSLFWFTVPYRPDFVSAATHRAKHSSIHGQCFVEAASCSLDQEGCLSSVSTTIMPVPIPATMFLQPESSGEVERRKLSPKCASVAAKILEEPTEERTIHRKRRVLLADDSPMVSKMTTMLMARQGFEVLVVENGAEMLDVLRESLECQRFAVRPVFDLVLSDLQMPVMDGLEATKRLRELERSVYAEHSVHHTVIGVSANDSEDIVNASQVCGFDGFIVKPFSILALEELLEDMGMARLLQPASPSASALADNASASCKSSNFRLAEYLTA